MKKIAKQEFIIQTNENLKEAGLAPELTEIDVAPCDCDWQKCEGWQVMHGFVPRPNIRITNIRIKE